MGDKQSKRQKPRQLNKARFELVIKKIHGHVKLAHDRRGGVARKKEKELLVLLNRKNRNQKDEYIKGSSIVGDNNYVDAAAIVLRYLQVLKDKSMNIVASHGDPSKIQEIVPYMVSVLWAGSKLNVSVMNELKGMMLQYFGPGVQDCIAKQHEVDKELISLFANLMPQPMEVNIYFRKFCDKYDIDPQKFNAVGHQAPEDPNFNPNVQHQNQMGSFMLASKVHGGMHQGHTKPKNYDPNPHSQGNQGFGQQQPQQFGNPFQQNINVQPPQGFQQPSFQQPNQQFQQPQNQFQQPQQKPFQQPQQQQFNMGGQNQFGQPNKPGNQTGQFGQQKQPQQQPSFVPIDMHNTEFIPSQEINFSPQEPKKPQPKQNFPQQQQPGNNLQFNQGGFGGQQPQQPQIPNKHHGQLPSDFKITAMQQQNQNQMGNQMGFGGGMGMMQQQQQNPFDARMQRLRVGLAP